MSSLDLGFMEKDDVQSFVEALQNADPRELPAFTTTFALGNEAAWYRFIKGAYHHPITWWIGIFQLQMQMGVWGHRYQGSASVEANRLWRLAEPLREEVSSLLKGNDAPLLSAILRYNVKYRKADVAGRLAGGEFTNYSSMGGYRGNARLPKTIKYPVRSINFIVASYGAAIKALAHGHKTIEAVVQSVLTGRPEHLPVGYRSDGAGPLNKEESKLLENFGSELSGVMSLTQIEPGPVPIKDFCSRPENINLKSICQ